MKFYFSLALLLVSAIAVQALNTETGLQKALDKVQPDEFLQGDMLKLISQDLISNQPNNSNPLQSVADLFQYYLDGTAFTNLLHSSFTSALTNGNSQLSKTQYYDAIGQLNVKQADANRVWTLLANNATSIDFLEFKDLGEVIYQEQLAITSFIFIRGAANHSRNDGLTIGDVKQSISLFFDNLGGGYPLPRCQELTYLFNQSDVNRDNMLNIEEFFYLTSIFLRFYRSGIQNNLYGSIVLRDNLFDLLWAKERNAVSTTTLFKDSFNQLFSLAIDEKSLNEVTHKIFSDADVDHHDSLKFTEFFSAIAPFGASKEEAKLLYAKGDSDHDGSVSFDEFAMLFESFIHRAASRFGYSLMQEVGREVDLSLTYTLFYDVVTHAQLTPISEEVYKKLFATADSNHNGVLDIEEFSQLDSAIISSMKSVKREQINKQTASTCVTAANK